MRFKHISALILCCMLGTSFDNSDIWGFYGHRLINKTAVFTLPVDLLPLYKSNIDFVTEHAIDPDKRRYASPLEAVRHYIDLDIWGAYPFEEIPRDFTDAIVKYSEVHVIDNASKDTLMTWTGDDIWTSLLSLDQKEQVRQEVRVWLFDLLDEKYLKLPVGWMPEQYSRDDHSLILTEHFSEYGILPYHLAIYQGRLTKAFGEKNWPLVIRLSTELGHYISDAHVPLHTTENYNGQLTGQDGIHAFWESRIPELFAASSYDFFVGRAKYIDDMPSYFWQIVLESHSYVSEVLDKELALRKSFDKDKQLECPEYAKAYQDAMAGMVEDRMRKSIQAVGSAWFTAWVDAGRPDVGLTAQDSALDTLNILLVDSLSLGGR